MSFKQIRPLWINIKQNRKLILYYGKIEETFFTSVKKVKIFVILRTKSCLKENQNYQPQFFWEILKAACFSADWVPKLIQKSFQTVEQNLVQRCETKVVADACNASYQLYCLQKG